MNCTRWSSNGNSALCQGPTISRPCMAQHVRVHSTNTQDSTNNSAKTFDIWQRKIIKHHNIHIVIYLYFIGRLSDPCTIGLVWINICSGRLPFVFWAWLHGKVAPLKELVHLWCWKLDSTQVKCQKCSTWESWVFWRFLVKPSRLCLVVSSFLYLWHSRAGLPLHSGHSGIALRHFFLV